MAGQLGRQIYNTARWRALRAAVLARDNRRCCRCGLAGADEVHHRRSIVERPDLAFEPSNLVSMHGTCHVAHHRPKVDGLDTWRRAGYRV